MDRELLLQQTRTAAAIQEAKLTRSIQKIEHRKYIFWIVLGVLALAWLGIAALRVYKKWQYMIQNITKARRAGSVFDKSGFMVALALEYPFLTKLRIANPHLPEAIQLAYYSAETTSVMGTGFTSDHDYLHELDVNSQKCSTDSPGWCSAQAIWCSVFGRDPSGNPIKDCFPACTNPSYENQGLNYTTKMTGWGINFGFAGHMVSSAFGAGGLGMGLAGFLAGTALGAWQAYNTHQQQVQNCKQQSQNCYRPPGAPAC